VFVLDSLLIGSLRFVLDKVVAAAEAEMQDDTALRERLLEAQMRLELGEIADDEFAAIERDVLARLRELKRERQGAISLHERDQEHRVEVELYDDRKSEV
jgi:gas vesicle protein GvpG